jgi:hypothetical protein
MESCHLVPLVLALGAAFVLLSSTQRREAFSPYYFPPSCFFEGPPEQPANLSSQGPSGAPQDWTPEELTEAVEAVKAGLCTGDEAYSPGVIKSVEKGANGVFRLVMMVHSLTRYFTMEIEAIVSGNKLQSYRTATEPEPETDAAEFLSFDKLSRDDGYFTSLQRLTAADLTGYGESGS